MEVLFEVSVLGPVSTYIPIEALDMMNADEPGLLVPQIPAADTMLLLEPDDMATDTMMLLNPDDMDVLLAQLTTSTLPVVPIDDLDLHPDLKPQQSHDGRYHGSNHHTLTGGYVFGYGGGGGFTGGGGGYDSDNYPQFETVFLDFLQDQCEIENQTDYAAQQIANAIKGQIDWDAREYGAIIYLQNGVVMMGPLVAGMTVAEAAAAGLSAPETRISLPADFVTGRDLILAVVHSHPDIGYDATEDSLNRYPSDYPGGGDYFFFDNVVGSDPWFSASGIFAQYILGPDGLLREFNSFEGRLSPANDPDPDARINLGLDNLCQG